LPVLGGKSSVLGKEIDNELAGIVENYMKHGIPMTIEDETVQALEENQFDIEIIQDDCSDTASSDAEEDEETEEEEEPTHEEKVQEPPKRQRKENTMVGGVRKGKYSK
jgi:hypothetical protein